MMGFNTSPLWQRLGAWLLAVSTILPLAGCGGGGDGPVAGNGVGVGGTGVVLGPVTGFGSIIVNGIRFDDSSASVLDDDGLTGTVKLGMMVTVESGAVTVADASGLASARATTIVAASEIKGPVTTKGTNTLTVLGQTVTVDTSTIYDNLPSGLAGIVPGGLVEIYATPSGPGTWVATRIEGKSALAEYKVSGLVGSATNATFTLGGVTISYGVLSARPQNGDRVRVKLDPASGPGVYTATKISSAALTLSDGVRAELEGVVTDFASLASFKINGQPVDASGAAVSVLNGPIANGQKVEVEGVVSQGVLVATKVERKLGGAETRLFGQIQSANAADKTLVVRGVTVVYDDNTELNDLTAEQLDDVGTNLEVRGYQEPNGVRVLATRIKLDN